MKIIGIDPAGKPENPTGFCILTENGSKAKTFFSDKEILEEVEKENPDLIAMDAPFSFPDKGYYREGDIKLGERGFPCLSPMFPGMKPLVRRAVKLVGMLGKKCRVIEVFPRATEKILGLEKERNANPHQYDALLCALTGRYYLRGEFKSLGRDMIIIPKPAPRTSWA